MPYPNNAKKQRLLLTGSCLQKHEQTQLRQRELFNQNQSQLSTHRIMNWEWLLFKSFVGKLVLAQQSKLIYYVRMTLGLWSGGLGWHEEVGMLWLACMRAMLSWKRATSVTVKNVWHVAFYRPVYPPEFLCNPRKKERKILNPHSCQIFQYWTCNHLNMWRLGSNLILVRKNSKTLVLSLHSYVTF